MFNSNNIVKYLNIAFNNQSPVTIWQSSTQKTFQLHGLLSEVNEKNTCIVVNEDCALLKSGEMIYFHCEGIDIIFKRDKFNVESKKISFKTPSELMLKEKRRIDRFKFKYQDFKDVCFSYEAVNKENEVLRSSQSFFLTDLSIAGLGCIGERRIIEDLDVGNEVFIKKISDQELDSSSVKGTIRSLCDYDLKEGVNKVEDKSKSKYVRVGIEFDHSIDQVQFSSIDSIITRTQRRTKGLDIDGFNGLSEMDMLRIIEKAGEENPILSKEIIEYSEDIDRLRYLTAEMKAIFWREVNKDLLAQALRFASKELIYSLLTGITDNIRNEFLEDLDSPKSLSAIAKAQEKICSFIHERERDGKFVLSAKGHVKYV